MITIVIADMHIRDERVLEWLRNRANGGSIQVSAYSVASAFGCHHKTAQAILRRLVASGHLQIMSYRRTGGYVYRIAA